LVYANANDFGSIFLLSSSSDDKVRDQLSLTTDFCDLVDQEENKETVYCEKKYAEFLNDSTVQEPLS